MKEEREAAKRIVEKEKEIARAKIEQEKAAAAAEIAKEKAKAQEEIMAIQKMKKDAMKKAAEAEEKAKQAPLRSPQEDGGGTRIRTGDPGFAIQRLSHLAMPPQEVPKSTPDCGRVKQREPVPRSRPKS